MARLSLAIRAAPQSTEGRVLLAIARAAIARNFGLSFPIETFPWLYEPGACFVTLKSKGEVRGCVGTLEAHRPLLDDVEANSIAAAFRDPRFAPLAEWELSRVRIEVSLLSALTPLSFADEHDAIARLQPGVHGVALEWGNFHATFLPQVWEDIRDPAVFLAQLKRKAGLSESFWSPEMKLRVYTVAKWKETELAQ